MTTLWHLHVLQPRIIDLSHAVRHYRVCGCQRKETGGQPATKQSVVDGHCVIHIDQTHCVHWWDDEGPCCACGDSQPAEATEAE